MESTRADPRFEGRLELEVRVGEAVYHGLTQNLSLGGLCAEVEAPAAFGDRLRLRLSLPTQRDPVEVEGEVRWVNRTLEGVRQLGFRFLGLRARDVWGLNKFFQTLPKPAAK